MYNCPMKHAYLIIAHHEFDILNKLIQAIDDAIQNRLHF